MNIECDYTVTEFAKANWEMNKKIRVTMIIVSIVFIPFLLLGILMFARTRDTIWIVFMAASLVLILFPALFVISLRPKSFAKRLVKVNPALKDGVHFAFSFEEDELVVHEKLSSSEGTSRFKYSLLRKVVIGKNYLYVFASKLAAYPIPLSLLDEKGIDEFKRLLGNKLKKR